MGHPKLGACWEGFALEEILRELGPGSNPHFWATHNGAELDLLWEKDGKRWGVEFKWTDAPSTTRSMHIAREDLGLSHLWVVHPGSRTFPLAEGISALALAEFRNRHENTL